MRYDLIMFGGLTLIGCFIFNIIFTSVDYSHLHNEYPDNFTKFLMDHNENIIKIYDYSLIFLGSCIVICGFLLQEKVGHDTEKI